MQNLFERKSAFANKEELARNKTPFCVLESPELIDTVYGEKWFLKISHDGIEETLTFGRTEKRDEDFMEAASHPDWYPQHNCYLRPWSVGGKSGYHLNQKSGGGPCACTTDVPVASDPFLPEWGPEEEQPVTPAPAPAATTLDSQPASPMQYMTIGKLASALNIEPDMPQTFGEAQKLIAKLEQDVNRSTAALARRS